MAYYSIQTFQTFTSNCVSKSANIGEKIRPLANSTDLELD